MKPPRFSPGEVVYHGRDKAVVLECINDDEPSDVKIQGYRYYVRHSGFVWSAPESALSLFRSKQV